MSTPPPSPSAPPPIPTPDLASEEADAARTATQMRMLAEIAEMGMELLRAAHAVARVAHVPANDKAFAAIARAVRHTLALQNWIVAARKTRAVAHAAAVEQATTQFRAQKTRHIHRSAWQVALAMPDFTKPQRVVLENFLTNIDLTGDIDRPVPEVLARICKALGVPPEKMPDLTVFAEGPGKVRGVAPEPPSCAARFPVTGSGDPQPHDKGPPLSWGSGSPDPGGVQGQSPWPCLTSLQASSQPP